MNTNDELLDNGARVLIDVKAQCAAERIYLVSFSNSINANPTFDILSWNLYKLDIRIFEDPDTVSGFSDMRNNYIDRNNYIGPYCRR